MNILAKIRKISSILRNISISNYIAYKVCKLIIKDSHKVRIGLSRDMYHGLQTVKKLYDFQHEQGGKSGTHMLSAISCKSLTKGQMQSANIIHTSWRKG